MNVLINSPSIDEIIFSKHLKDDNNGHQPVVIWNGIFTRPPSEIGKMLQRPKAPIPDNRVRISVSTPELYQPG